MRQGIIAQDGFEDNMFRTANVLAKHDETYMPREVAENLKEQGSGKEIVLNDLSCLTSFIVALIASCCQAICLFMAVLQKGTRAA